MAGLAGKLEKAGHRCFTPTLEPSNGSLGIPELAEQLSKWIEDYLPGVCEFVLVGFSLGAMVSRCYLQNLGGYRRVRGYFSICGPHAGTMTAYLGRSEVAHQLRPGSELLRDLDRTSALLAKVPKVCYWNRFDLMIFPGKSARWSLAIPVEARAVSHMGILSSKILFKDLQARMPRFSYHGKLDLEIQAFEM